MKMQKPPEEFARLIAVDLDGTLVGPDNSVSAENIAAIQRAGQQGAAVVIVSGRPYVSADGVARRVGLPAVPLVTFNGALIRWPDGGDVLYQCCVPADLAAEVVEECHREQLYLQYYLHDELYVTQYNDWARLYCERNGMSCKVIPDMSRFAGEEPLKLLVADRPERINGLLPRYQERWRDRLYVTRSMREYLEFLSPQVSKGRALDWLLDFYGLRREHTLAIGDSLNDLPLLEHAGHAVAMPNSDAELQEIAEFVPREQPTGVADAIDWFLTRAK
jgi:Cof subfamily protein (haloacid dehalogenase superfamily)